jgi:RNA polymerase-binding protein DksA
MSPARKATSARSGASSKAKKTTAKAAPKKTAKKTSARKTPAKAAKKTAAKKATPRKTAAAPKKTAAKKPAAKKVTAKKPPAKPSSPAKTSVPKAATPAVSKAKPLAKKPVTRPSPPAPPKKKIKAAKFTPDQLKKIRANLEEKKSELTDRQREIEEASFDSTQSDITGEVGIDEDFADAGTATFERERDLSIRNNIRDLIDQVTRAVQRIDDGNYGTCERCGNPIDATRLRELPHASLCLDCKRREERAR